MRDTTEQLFDAVAGGDRRALSRLIGEGVDLEARNGEGETPLMVAAKGGDLGIVQELVRGRANVNARVAESQGSGGIKVVSVGPGAGTNFGQLIAEATEHADDETRSVLAGVGEILDLLKRGEDVGDVGLKAADDGEGSSAEGPEEGDDWEGEEPEWDENEDMDYDRATPLNLAISQGHTEVALALVDAGAEVEAPSWDLTPPLALAASHGNLAVVDRLLEAGARPDRGMEYAPLEAAACAGHLEVVERLLEAGAEVDVRGEDGFTPLMGAAAGGHLAVVQALVEAGADPTAVGDGDTALACAAREGHEEVSRYLEPLVTDEIREYAREERQRGIERRERERGRDDAGEALVEAAMMGELAKVEKLIAAGAPLSYVGRHGHTALMYASSYGHMPVVELLLVAGADVDTRSRSEGDVGRTALMQASGSFFATNRVEVVERLLAAGAGIDLQDDEGDSALMHAVKSGTGYGGSVEALLKAGADPELADRDGNTPIMMAASKNAAPIVEQLAAAGASRDGIASVELIDAAEEGRLEDVERLIAAGADVDHRLGVTPLIAAATEGRTEVVKALLAAGADLDKGQSDPPDGPDEPYHGDFNPLLLAAYGAHVETVEALIEAGADLAVRLSGRTALDYARLGREEGNFPDRRWDETIELLVSAGAPGRPG